MLNKIRLTQTVKKGGCAAKMPAQMLKQVLAGLSQKKPEALIVGSETMDDACLWNIGNDKLMIQTLDFFTPIVDDPEDFGAIAAANALSDVYAMGGQPCLALGILAFPIQSLSLEVLKSLMNGAINKMNEAGVFLAGGHSIDDESLKFGFCISGFVNSNNVWTNAGARPGDSLILTKAIGTGTLTSAAKTEKISPESEQALIHSMKTLNKVKDLLCDYDNTHIHSATDITGFGLIGHSLQMAQASKTVFRFEISEIPLLPGSRQSILAGHLNRAHKTNFDYVADSVEWGKITDVDRMLCVDAQTSGGLLLSVSKTEAPEILKRLQKRFPQSAIIGEVLSKDMSQQNTKNILF